MGRASPWGLLKEQREITRDLEQHVDDLNRHIDAQIIVIDDLTKDIERLQDVARLQTLVACVSILRDLPAASKRPLPMFEECRPGTAVPARSEQLGRRRRRV